MSDTMTAAEFRRQIAAVGLPHVNLAADFFGVSVRQARRLASEQDDATLSLSERKLLKLMIVLGITAETVDVIYKRKGLPVPGGTADVGYKAIGAQARRIAAA